MTTQNRRFDTRLCTRALLALSFCFLLGSQAARAADVIVIVGSSVRIPVAEGVKKITVANPSVLDARPSQDGMSALVNGIAEGTSELRIEKMQGADLIEHVVVHADLNGTLDQIKALLTDVEGLNISVIGSKIVLKGNIITKADYDNVTKVVEAYSGVILNLSTFDRSQMNKYVEEAILKDIGLDTVTARVMGDTVILEGVVFSESAGARAVEVAKLRMPNVKSLLRVQDVMIETDVQFVQVSGNKNSNIGSNVLDSLTVGLTGSGSGGPSAGGAFPMTYGVSGSATARIQAIVGDGLGKITAQPHISTKSGEVGTFQSGGTKYFSVAGNVGGSLQSVDYGVILKVKPTMQGRDQVLNEVTVEVSIPIADATGVLTLQKYSTTCTSLCKVGESMVLSGLVQQMANNTSSKTPILGDVPLLNLFFSTNVDDKTRNEFVIVVTPQPIFPTGAADKPYGTQHGQVLQDKS